MKYLIVGGSEEAVLRQATRGLHPLPPPHFVDAAVGRHVRTPDLDPMGVQMRAVARGGILCLTSGGRDAAERELRKVPFFVRGKARRNTEAFALLQGAREISVDLLYEAKAHYAR